MPGRPPGHGRPGGPGPRGPLGAPTEKPKDSKKTLKRLLKYLAPYKFLLLLVLVFVIIAAAFDVIAPAQLGRATTCVFEGAQSIAANEEGASIDFDLLRSILTLLIALYVLQGVFSYFQTYVMAHVAQSMFYDVRAECEEKINKIPLSYFDKKSKGDLLSRVINDVDLMSSTLQDNVTQFISGVISLLGILAMMLFISPLMTLIALCTLPLSAFGTITIARRSQKLFLAQQNSLGTLDGHIEENYSAHVELKAFTHEKPALDEFSTINNQYFNNAWRAQFISGVIRPIMQFIGDIGYIAICIIGAWQVILGAIAVGDIQAFAQYMRNFTRPIAQIASIMNSIQAMLAGAERVFDLLDAPEMDDELEYGEHHTAKEGVELKEGGAVSAGGAVPGEGGAVSEELNNGKHHTAKYGVSDTRGEVIFDHINFGYEKNNPVIKDFSIKVKPGSQVAIVGPTGAGKSTLVNLLMRFYDPDSGKILLDKQDIKKMPRQVLRSHLGMVLQETWLFSGTIKQNIAYGREGATDDQIKNAAKAAYIDHFICTLPDGYDTMINEEASNISTGQRQLITIARAILADPEILILDEATSNIDSRTEKQVQSAMRVLMHNRTTFVIAHRLSTIRSADVILVLNKGNIVEQGTHEELLESRGFYANLYNSQFVDCIDELNE